MGMPVAITISIVVARRVAIAIAIMAVMRVAVVRSGMHKHTDYTPNILGSRRHVESIRPEVRAMASLRCMTYSSILQFPQTFNEHSNFLLVCFFRLPAEID